MRRVSTDHHLTVQSSKRNTFNQQRGDGNVESVGKSGRIGQSCVCALDLALVCVMGTVQATHSHPEILDHLPPHLFDLRDGSCRTEYRAGASAPVLAMAVLAIVLPKFPRSSVPLPPSLFVLRLRSDSAPRSIRVFPKAASFDLCSFRSAICDRTRSKNPLLEES